MCEAEGHWGKNTGRERHDVTGRIGESRSHAPNILQG
jgi:hypothetical protein